MAMFAVAAPTSGAQPSALTLFTNLADTFLRGEFNYGISEVQIAPTNQYSPQVHRLL